MPILDFGPPSSAHPGDLPGALKLHGPTLPVVVFRGFDLQSVPRQYRDVVDVAVVSEPTEARSVQALLDCGSALNCIDQPLADALGLALIDRRQIGGVAGVNHVIVYLASVLIPGLNHTIAGDFVASNIRAGSAVHQVAIGRPLLRQTLMVYDGRIGRVTLCL